MALQNNKKNQENQGQQQNILPATQIAFEQSFNLEISSFVDIFFNAHQMTMGDLTPKGLKYQMRMTKSTLMNGNIKGLLFDQFPNEMKESKSSRFYLHRQKGFILLFKKLDDKLMPNNINTKNSRKILAQYAIDFEEDLPIVFVGYTVNKTWDRITQVVAVYIKDGKKVWVSDLLNRGGSSTGTITGNLFTPPVAGSDDLVVKPKTKQDSQKAS
jgi:hypothetical protein